MTDTTTTTSAPAASGTGRVLPIYLVGDVSGSMFGPPIEQVNALMPSLMSVIHTNPLLADLVHLAVWDFSDQASCLLPLGRIIDAPGAPNFAGGGGTNYAAAFDAVANAIASDVPSLKAAGKQVIRPCVFFYTDGQPTCSEADWKAAFSRLADRDPSRVHANVIPFGVMNADGATIQFMSRPQGYIMDGTFDLAEAMKRIIEAIMKSLVSSAASLHAGGGMQLPTQVPGFITVNGDTV